MASISEDFSTNLVEHWSLEETSGNRTGSHASKVLADNNSVLYGTGVQGNGADFELDNNEYLSLSDNSLEPSSGSTAFTVSFWFKPETLGGLRGLLSKENGAKGWLFYTSDSVLTFMFQGTGSVGGATLTPGTLYHIVGTYDGTDTATSGKLYVSSGGTADSTPDTANIYPYVDSASGVFKVGERTPGTGNSDGIIDEISIVVGTAWSASTVATVYNSGNGIPYASSTTFTPRIMFFT